MVPRANMPLQKHFGSSGVPFDFKGTVLPFGLVARQLVPTEPPLWVENSEARPAPQPAFAVLARYTKISEWKGAMFFFGYNSTLFSLFFRNHKIFFFFFLKVFIY